jgi:iron complex outermembrane recepter protein
LERVDVLPGTGSALYGANAVGGVVNFILRTNYEGRELTFTYGDTTSGDAAERKVTLLLGAATANKRTSFTVAANWADSNAMKDQDRGFAVRLRQLQLARDPAVVLNSNSIPSFRANIRTVSGGPLGIPGSTASTASVPAGTAGPITAAGFTGTAGQFDLDANHGFNGIYYRAPQSQSYSGGVNFEHKLTSNLRFFGEASLGKNQTIAFFEESQGDVVPVTNPHNPFGIPVRVSLQTRDAGLTRFSPSTKNSHAAGGFSFRPHPKWNVVADYVYDKNVVASDSTNLGDFLLFRGAINGTTAATAYNPFLDLSVARNPQAVIDTFKVVSLSRNNLALTQWAVRGAGEAAAFLAEPVRVALGVEEREEKAYNGYSSRNFQSNGAPAVGGFAPPFTPGVNAARRVFSAYAETVFTLFGESNQRKGARRLELEVAGRYERFSDFGTSTNPQLGLLLHPVRGVALRSSYGEGFLAPTLSQFSSVVTAGTVGGGVTDPRRGGQAVAPTTPTVTGGNPNLNPETSVALTYGLVFEPTAVKGLRISADYFRVEKEDIITNLSSLTLMNNESSFPFRVTRGALLPTDPAGFAGPVTGLDVRPINTLLLETDGWDFSLDYSRPMERGTFNVSAQATYVGTYRVQTAINGPLVSQLNAPRQSEPFLGREKLGNRGHLAAYLRLRCRRRQPRGPGGQPGRRLERIRPLRLAQPGVAFRLPLRPARENPARDQARCGRPQRARPGGAVQCEHERLQLVQRRPAALLFGDLPQNLLNPDRLPPGLARRVATRAPPGEAVSR